ncbi:MAG: hypothetical protein FWC64_11780 [Treponema sp.]|nr:hypothetical protein [Treponema sp.]
MKKIVRVLGIAVLAALIGFSLAACDNPAGTGGISGGGPTTNGGGGGTGGGNGTGGNGGGGGGPVTDASYFIFAPVTGGGGYASMIKVKQFFSSSCLPFVFLKNASIGPFLLCD